MPKVKLLVAVGALVLACVTVTLLYAQAPQSAGASTIGSATRFQLVAQHEGTMWLVDSMTGRVWRYSRLTDSAGQGAKDSPCSGLLTCFFEVDRVRLTVDGYTSELVRAPSK